MLSYKDKWYCYYAVSTFGVQNSGIGVASSPNMEPGSWTDHGEVIQSVTGDLYNTSEHLSDIWLLLSADETLKSRSLLF